MILLRSGTEGKSLSNTARAGLASPALHTNALNWRNYQNVTSFIDTTLLSSLVKSLFCFLLSQPSLPWHLPAPGSLRLQVTPKHMSSCDWCSTKTLIPPAQSLVLCQWLLDKVTHLGRTGKMVTLLTYTLQDLCFLFLWKKISNYFSVWSGTRTKNCHPAVKWTSACTARCLHSVLKKYIPHLPQRYAPDTSISCGQDLLWGPEQDLPLICHESKTNAMKSYLFFNVLFLWWRLLKITARTNLCYSLLPHVLDFTRKKPV